MKGKSTRGAEFKCEMRHGTRPDPTDINAVREHKRQESERRARLARGADYMLCKAGGPLAGLNISLDFRVIDVWSDDEDDLYVQYVPDRASSDTESAKHLKLVQEGRRRYLGRYTPDYIRGGFFWEPRTSAA